MAADEKGILRMVEDKLTQLLGKVIRKEPAMMNRPPTGGSHGDVSVRLIGDDVRLYINCGGKWRYTPLFKELPRITADSDTVTIDGSAIVNDATEVGIIRYVKELQYSGTTLQYKFAYAYIVGGIVVHFHAPSAWIDVPTV